MSKSVVKYAIYGALGAVLWGYFLEPTLKKSVGVK
jgi:hypothetical protein